MRKFTLFLVFLLFVGMQAALAQVEVKGTVLDAKDGIAIPGVSIVVKGTLTGTVTDINGKYLLSVPKGYNELIFSFVGMLTKEVKIDGKAVIDISMEEDVIGLEEVVVTALGITREKKALGYSVQDVKGSDIQTDGGGNVINQLSGRVAGVQVTSASGNMGGSSRVIIRGINSISGNNQPLYVVDGTIIDNSDFNTVNTARGAGGYDYGNMAQDINPDDIASISVLKGANAAALYGSRAANGVILITTKKGERQKGKQVGIEFSTGLSFEQVAYLPEYQNNYGGGNGGLDATWEVKTYEDNSGYYKVPGVDADGNPYQSFDLGMDYGIDESFGPAYSQTAGEYLQNYGIDLTGTEYADKPIYYRPWNSFDSWDTQNYGKSIEWKAPAHDVKDFFQTGLGWNNNIAFTGGSDAAQIRLALGSLNSTGYMPNSNLDRYTASLNATVNLTKDLRAFGSYNYISNTTKGRSETGYGDVNPVERFNQWGQRQLDMDVQKNNYINPDGTQRSWNRTSMDDPTPAYSNNPYWDRNMNYENDKRDRYYGNVGLLYQINSWLKAQGKVNMDNYTFRTQQRVAIGSASQSYYQEEVRTNSELNAEFLFMVDKTFSTDWRLNANLGGNLMDRKYKLNSASTVGGLIIPELYTVSNSLTNVAADYKSWKRINSIYASASLGWKSMVFLDVTLRNDWSSTLPKNNNSYLYPSVSLSWLITELEAVKDAKWLTLAKIRGSWAQVGNDTDPYRTSLNYAFMLDANNYPYHFPPYGMYTLSNTLNNESLKPEMTRSWEIGTELKFFANRLGLDFTYYDKASKNQIIPVAVSGASGYSFEVLNAGLITNKGIELFLTGVPVRLKDNKFEWTITANFAKNKNQVVELYPGIDNLQLGTAPFLVTVNALVGQEYGQLMGSNFIFDANGNKVVGENGRYLKSAVTSLGSVLPKWNMGIGNDFSFLGFDLSFLFDFQNGGKFFSTTYMWGTYTGILAGSDVNNMREDGVIIDAMVAAVDGDGNVLYNADGTAQVTGVNTTSIDAYTWTTDHYNGPAAQNILDASYIKLRDLTLSYTIPAKLTGPVKNLRIGLYGRNLATFGTAVKGIDPETSNSSGNVQGIEGAGLPMVRTFGFNVGFNF
jgi:TonB-linked SusC/RagA family outer membrane protein